MATLDVPLVNQFVVGVAYDAPNVANVTGATAGIPGSWTPAGAEMVPASVAALQGANPPIIANPATAWTVGQYVQTGTAGASGQAFWNGTAWTAGTVPVGGASFDPGAHTVAEVEEYLAAHPDETDAVLAAEAAGKNRASLTG